MISLAQIAFALFAILLLCIARAMIDRLAYKRKMRREGCQSIPQYPHKDPILGYDLYKITADGTSRGTSIATRMETYLRCGQDCKTFQSKRNGDLVINTFDKDNIQAILGQSSAAFVRSPLSAKIADPFLGKGILTSEGKAWKQSRAVAAAAFCKGQAADLPSLENHIQKMLLLIPADGSTIDLQPLLKRLVSES